MTVNDFWCTTLLRDLDRAQRMLMFGMKSEGDRRFNFFEKAYDSRLPIYNRKY